MEILDLRDAKLPLMEAEFAIASLRARGGHVLKVLHREDRSRGDLRALFRRLRREGSVSVVLPGESFGARDNEATAYLVDKYPELENDPDFSSENEGITLVSL